MAGEGWGEEEICAKGGGRRPNMAGRINDRELITFARPNKTAVLQAIKAEPR